MSISRVTALGASLVWSVEKTRCPVSEALIAMRGGLQVADFPDHDHVRRLAQNRAQGAGKGQPDRFADLHLVDARQQIFDRVLDRDDLAVRPVDEMQAGVERGGLARAGGAGDQQDAVRQADEPLEGLLVVGEEAQLRQAQPQPFLVQDTHDDALAVVGRQAGHAQVDELAAHRRLDAPVLRDPVLGDGHVGLDLQAADDGGLQPFGWGFDLVQHAVNPVAHAEHLRQRLQVNVRSAHLERLDDDRS